MLTIEPRGRQATALNMLRGKWKQAQSFLLYAPVGFGKTAIAAFITDGFVSRNLRVMFVAPYTVLLDQTATRFIDYGLPAEEIAYIWRNHPSYNPHALIQIASADTLIRREFPDNIDLLIVDECHLRRKTLLQTIERLTTETQTKVIGLSGTPFSKWLGNYYAELIKPTTMKELIQMGHLSPYEFYAPSHPDLSSVGTTYHETYGADYNESDIARVMSDAKLVDDIVRNWLEHGDNLPSVCFCVNVAHANFVTIEFNRAGVQAEVMTALTPHAERQLIIQRFERGITKIIVNVGVLVAGFDSDVRCIVYARPTKSETRWIQIIGRGLRTAPGKKVCRIFDHTGTVNRLGFPDDIEYDYLKTENDGMEQKALTRVISSDTPDPLPRQCPKCSFMKPVGMPICPMCGFKPLVGRDVATDTTRKLKKIGKSEDKPTKETKQGWWSQILFYQKTRAMQGKPLSDAWCARVFHNKFQSWPNGLIHSAQEITPEVANYIKSQQIAWAKRLEKKRKEGAAA
ncbi:ATP-dependent helicase [Salmonella enterica]|uniref:ATP-dependent helicase n=1 Tax=Salmonella enterica subsp. enterica serovar Cardoner TaxID=2564309 RepID=A0A5V6PUL0_SALET|nr:ATP-dependent helicase [Salmonella enterica subsp. enterica]EAO9717151.1 DEAD/DEAH box helicase [Salmonella enterica]EBF8123404.1 DEAD/DEAH box helicase [Salmonella enterica subsp. enterica serovar Aba]EBU8204146.1 ATP-dependent helicase [Salmonella enterica subsp. enterica serovar Cardoner]ECT8306967.1 DEAD/DEAH box helicase [Salmonella enterica subsp. enterica serovar Llandoff]EEI6240606.1 DEAD/DEAH box helicase [Salmonella enterica subsp. enterica serovar Tudu]EGC2275397.1 DEAD/DEAH box